MAMLDSISEDLQREIVSALPEIIDDHQHEAVVTQLQELMQSNPAKFMAPVLGDIYIFRSCLLGLPL